MQRSKVGLRKGRVDWNLSENLVAGILSQYGLHATAIEKATGLSRSAIYYRNKKKGIRITDYRNGNGPVAQQIMHQFSIQTIEELSKTRVKKIKHKLRIE